MLLIYILFSVFYGNVYVHFYMQTIGQTINKLLVGDSIFIV
jgi:hypothetical protein